METYLHVLLPQDTVKLEKLALVDRAWMSVGEAETKLVKRATALRTAVVDFMLTDLYMCIPRTTETM